MIRIPTDWACLIKLLFTPPAPYVLAALSWLLCVIILPAPIILSIVGFLFPHWPRHQLYVLRSFLRSPRAVFSALAMARHEMRTVHSLSSTGIGVVLQQESRRIWAYYGDADDWVPVRMAESAYKILREAGGARTRQEVAAEKGKGKFQGGTRRKWLEGVCGEVVFGTGIPHDFCISKPCSYFTIYTGGTAAKNVGCHYVLSSRVSVSPSYSLLCIRCR